MRYMTLNYPRQEGYPLDQVLIVDLPSSGVIHWTAVSYVNILSWCCPGHKWDGTYIREMILTYNTRSDQ